MAAPASIKSPANKILQKGVDKIAAGAMKVGYGIDIHAVRADTPGVAGRNTPFAFDGRYLKAIYEVLG